MMEWSEAVRTVCARHKVTLDELRAHRRHARLVNARRDLVFALRSAPILWSVPRIARFLRRDHTTIYHHMTVMGMPRGVIGKSVRLAAGEEGATT